MSFCCDSAFLIQLGKVALHSTSSRRRRRCGGGAGGVRCRRRSRSGSIRRRRRRRRSCSWMCWLFFVPVAAIVSGHRRSGDSGSLNIRGTTSLSGGCICRFRGWSQNRVRDTNAILVYSWKCWLHTRAGPYQTAWRTLF